MTTYNLDDYKGINERSGTRVTNEGVYEAYAHGSGLPAAVVNDLKQQIRDYAATLIGKNVSLTEGDDWYKLNWSYPGNPQYISDAQRQHLRGEANAAPSYWGGY